MSWSLNGRNILVTGITDDASLATAIAAELSREGANVVCSGLAPTPHHEGLSDRARDHLATTWESFGKAVERVLGCDAWRIPCDVTLDASLRDLADEIAGRGVALDGVVHAVARDRSLGRRGATPLWQVSRDEFLDCLDVSAYSLVALVRELLDAGALARGASLVTLSYLGAERSVAHPYKNVAVAKAALERITVELARELGPLHGVRANAVRFSPYTESRAGGAIPGLVESQTACSVRAPLGNARPEDLAREVVHLMRPGQAITGEIRNVDGGYRILAGDAA